MPSLQYGDYNHTTCGLIDGRRSGRIGAIKNHNHCAMKNDKFQIRGVLMKKLIIVLFVVLLLTAGTRAETATEIHLVTFGQAQDDA